MTTEAATLTKAEQHAAETLEAQSSMTWAEAVAEIVRRRDPWYYQGVTYEPSQLRRLLIAYLEDAEAELAKAQEGLDICEREMRQAESARDLAYEHRQQRRATVKNLRAEVLRRFPEPAE